MLDPVILLEISGAFLKVLVYLIVVIRLVRPRKISEAPKKQPANKKGGGTDKDPR